MQNSDESLNWLPGLIRKLATEYLGRMINHQSYQERLDDLDTLIINFDELINPDESVCPFRMNFQNIQRYARFNTLKVFMSEPPIRDASLKALKEFHMEATTALAEELMRLPNALKAIPTQVWTWKILPSLENRSLNAFAQSCKLFQNQSKHSFSRRYNRHLLAELIQKNMTSEVQDLLATCAPNDTIKTSITPELLLPYEGGIREHSPFYVAAMNRYKPMFDLLVSKLPQPNLKLHELLYLVISNEGNMHLRTWKFQAETFLNDNDPTLIFQPGPDGLSPFQIAAVDKDIHMLLTLLTVLKKIYPHSSGDFELIEEWNLEQNWQKRVWWLIEDCPISILNTLVNQLKAVGELGAYFTESRRKAPFNSLTEAKPYLRLYSDSTVFTLNAIGKVQNLMPLHARADIFFHSHGSNQRENIVTLSYYKRCDSRFFRLDHDLFLSFSELGGKVLVRGSYPTCRLIPDSCPESSFEPLKAHMKMDALAIDRFFEVRTKQLHDLYESLEQVLSNENDPGLCAPEYN